MNDIGFELHPSGATGAQILRSPRGYAHDLPPRRPIPAGKKPKTKKTSRLYTPYEMAKLLTANATGFTSAQSDF